MAAAVAALLLLLLTAATTTTTTTVQSIGVNYGTLGDNLPPPAQVAQFLKDKTTIDRVKIFDANPDILRAFADTAILVSVTIPNDDIPSLLDPAYASSWVASNLKPFHPRTKIRHVLVGNEILHWGPQNLRDSLVPAMRSLHAALQQQGLTDVKVTTAHSLAILVPSDLPSLARFRPGWDTGVLAPMLQFHRETKTPFMVNPYPYFAYSPEKADLALFRHAAAPVYDKFTRRSYGNVFDELLDSVYISMMRLGYKDVEIAVGETGWASQGETYEQPKCSVPNAQAYVAGLVRHYNSGRGTPMMPRRKFDTYLFGLFNENQKPGSLAERNFGLFRPDFSPVYDAGVMRTGPAAPNVPTPTPGKPTPPVTKGGKWCVAKSEASDSALQKNLDWVCSQGIDCKPINVGGACFAPNTVRAHASFAMNSYYHAKGLVKVNCDFSGTGLVTATDPSTGTCKYVS